MANKKKKGGNPGDYGLTLTEEILTEAVRLAKLGNFRQDIAKRLKIRIHTWESWVTRGKRHLKEIEEGEREGPTLQSRFVEELEKADAEARCQLMEDICASDDVRTKLKFLQLRHGKYFAQNQTAIDGDTGEERKIDVNEILLKKLNKFLGE